MRGYVGLCLQALWCFLLLSACTGNQGAAYQSIHQVVFGNNPDFKALPRQADIVYLDVDISGTQARLGRGYLYPTSPSPTEVYYSAKSEVFRLQANRLLATGGLPLNLTDVKYQFDGQGGVVASFSVGANGMGNQRVQAQLVGPLLPPNKLALPEAQHQASQWVWYGARVVNSSVFPNGFMYLSLAFVKPLTADQLNKGVWPQAAYGIQCIQPEYCIQWYRP